MKKLYLLLILLAASPRCLPAQEPPATPPKTNSTTASATNREDVLRRALRQVIETNAPTRTNRTVARSPGSTNTNLTGTNVALPALPVPSSGAAANTAAVPGAALQPVQTRGLTVVPAPLPGTNVTAGVVVPAVPTTTTTATPGGAAAAGPPAIPPGVPAALPAAPTSVETGAAVTKPSGEDAVPTMSWKDAPLDQILEYYANLTGRTILRPAALVGTVTIKTQSTLTRSEAILALNSVLALNGITMINVGEKFVKAILAQQALQEGAAFSKLDADQLPEADQFVTHIVHLKNSKPTEVVPALTPFAKNPAGIVGLDTSGLIVLRDYSANVKRMLEIIEKVDVVAELDYKLEVIPIRYGKVEDIYQTMSSLIGGSGGAPAGGASTRRTSSRQTTQIGTQGLQQQRQQPYQQQQLQQPNVGGAQASFQQRLNQIVNRAAGGNDAQLLTDAKIIPDERSNTLIVFASKQDLAMITNIVSKVDVLLAQVLIEAIVMEVSLDNNRNLGVSMQQKPKMFSDQFSGAGGINNGQNFLDFKNVTNFSGALPGGLSYFGRLGNDFDVAVTAIASDSTVNVMSRPRIQTSHAVPGSFFVGNTVPYITGSSYGYGGYGGISGDPYGGSRSTYTQLSVGISLDVTPFITPDGLVVMEIDQNIEQLGTSVKIDNNDVPTTVRRTAKATLSVRDRDTIMLGGYISSDKSKTKSGVPLLKDVPLLGALFRNKSDLSKRTELIVLMRPTVLQTPQDAALIAREELERLPGVQRAQAELLKEEKKRRLDADKSLLR